MPSPTGQPATHDRFTRAFVPLSKKERDRRAVLGGAFMLASRMGMVVVGMGSVMVLARVLEPADFGLLAMALLFFKFVGKFRRFGLSDAAT